MTANMVLSPVNLEELEEEVKKILVLFDLKEHHAEYCKQSFESLRPKYHNEAHCYSTALTFYKLAIEGRVGLEETRHGFVAAIYHDANHRMAKNDRENITSALRWIRKNDFFEDSLSMLKLAKLIRATENTNKIFASKTEELLHDADVLQTVKGNVFENVYWQRKLAEELVATIDVKESLRFVSANLRATEAIELFKKTVGTHGKKNNPAGFDEQE